MRLSKWMLCLMLVPMLAACDTSGPTAQPTLPAGGYPVHSTPGLSLGYPPPGPTAQGYPPPLPTRAPSAIATATGTAPVVIYKDFEIVPAHLTISVGTTVTFLVESASGAHYRPYNADAPNIFEAPDMTNGATWSFTFIEPGDVIIRCRYHDQMTATITVTP